MVGKGLKRAGYCVFGLREYMSVIKNGHSSYQLDISDDEVRSSQEKADAVVTFNHHGILKNLRDLKSGGILLHQTPQWKFGEDDRKFINENEIKVIYLPTEVILKKLDAAPVLGNVLITSVVWSMLGRPLDELKELVREQFGHKKNLLELNFKCIEEGAMFKNDNAAGISITLPPVNDKWKDNLFISGSQAMGLGVINAGCRAFFSYPMTPASPVMSFIADMQGESKMLVKQAEDEITAAQMMVGAMHMGTRAATATSGGGYDLMTETISMCGVSETPAVFILAQRPGPGTGLPTWSAQGDLLMAASAGHGEFPRLVMSVSDAEDSFSLMMDAFNYAEEYQMPVTVLTEKHIAESLFTTDKSLVTRHSSLVKRGKLVIDEEGLNALKSTDRYSPSVSDGISARWLPGSEAPTYCAQSYEHSADGSFDESSENTVAQVNKRIRKMEALKRTLSDAELYSGIGIHLRPESDSFDILIVSWGSNKNPILDAITAAEVDEPLLRIGYLHYTYLWPLKTAKLMELSKKAKRIILIEGNRQGQLGMLIKQECGFEFDDRILKYDGRVFSSDELASAISKSV